MRKTISFCMLLFAFCIFLTACGNKKCEQHVYDDCADTECNVCGETRDSMHSWKDATCTTLKTCTVCQATEGEMLPHNWEDATCITAKTCKTCKATEGEPLGHTPAEDDGNCTTPIKCVNCEQDAKAGATGHHDADHDYLCDNAGCQVTVGNPPKDENDGIDLPIDRN